MKKLIKMHFKVYGVLYSLLIIGITITLSLILGSVANSQASIDYDSIAVMQYGDTIKNKDSEVSDFLEKNPQLTLAEKEELIAVRSHIIEILQGMIDSRLNDDWRTELTLALDLFNAETEMTKLMNEIPINSDRDIAIYTYHLDNDIPPKVPVNIYDGYSSIIYYLRDYAFIVFSLVPFLAVSLQIFTEKTGGASKLLLGLPVKRQSVLLSKFVSVLLVTLTSTLLPIITIFIINSALMGTGNLADPIPTISSFMITQDVVIQSILPMLSSLLFFVSLSIMFYVLFTKETICLSVSVLITVISLVLQSSFFSELLFYLPIVSGNAMNLLLNFDFINIYLASISGLILSPLIILYSVRKFNKIDN